MNVAFFQGDVKRNRLIGIIAAIIYVITYDYIVREFLVAVFGYMLKYTYHPFSQTDFFIYGVICVVPLLFYKSFNHLASLLSFFCYVLVYIPFMHTLFVAGYPPFLAWAYKSFFFITQCVFFLTDSMQLGRKIYSEKKIVSFHTFEKICVVLMLILIALNINKMHMVNIFNADEKEMLYDLRAENGSTSSAFNSYLMGWMNHILLPILMVCYMQEKKYVKLTLAFGAMIIVFMIDMQKISFLIPFVIVIFYYLYKYFTKLYLDNFHVMLLLAFAILSIYALNFLDTSLGFTIAAMLIMRTLCVEGRQFGTYFDFFELNDNPYTYYTHINIIDKVTGLYPYSHSLGYEVSYGEANSNATFFLMDGIAGGGFIGCIIIAILFIIFKAYFNTIGNNYDRAFCIIILFFAISSLMNSSLFTSLLTGGFLPFYIICRTVDLKPIEHLNEV